MQKSLLVSFVCISLTLLSGCYVSHVDGQKSFAADLRERGVNPYIKHDVFRDLERRIRAIAMAPVTPNSPRAFDARQMEILSNFSELYDHQEFEQLIHAARAGGRDYTPVNNQTSCTIRPSTMSVPSLMRGSDSRIYTAQWEFIRGTCDNNNLAHGQGIARSVDGKAELSGIFDRGQLIEGTVRVTYDTGDHAIYMGGIPNNQLLARGIASYFNVSGYQNHRYGDFNEDGELDGFGINVRNYKGYMLVKHAGSFKNDDLNGFGAMQDARKHGDGKVWNAWLGTFKGGEGNGLGSWTNGVDAVSIAEWNNGKRNGVEFRQYSDMTGDYHSFGVGQQRNGKRQGKWTFTLANSFNSNYPLTEVYDNGNLISTSDKPAFSFDQIMAFSMGAAIIGASDIPSAAKLQIGEALAQDTLGGGGGSNLAALQKSFASRANSTITSNEQAATTTGQANSNESIPVENVTITCSSSGTTSTIPIPYRTQMCRRAAIDFATTYACNKFDQERVIRNCNAACGHPQCLQK